MNKQIERFSFEFDYLSKLLILTVSIILYGSFGRVRAIYSSKKEDKLLNDIDILLIVKKISINTIEKIKISY